MKGSICLCAERHPFRTVFFLNLNELPQIVQPGISDLKAVGVDVHLKLNSDNQFMGIRVFFFFFTFQEAEDHRSSIIHDLFPLVRD